VPVQKIDKFFIIFEIYGHLLGGLVTVSKPEGRFIYFFLLFFCWILDSGSEIPDAKNSDPGSGIYNPTALPRRTIPYSVQTTV